MQRLKARNIILQLDEKAKDSLVGRAMTRNTELGRCAARGTVPTPAGGRDLKGSFHEGEPILVSADADHLVFNQKAAAEGALS